MALEKMVLRVFNAIRHQMLVRLRELLFTALSRDLSAVRFVQIGSNDGSAYDPLQSVVKKHHWSGVLVEPIPEQFELLEESYSGCRNLTFVQAAISDRIEVKPFYFIERIAPEECRGIPDWYDKLGSFDPKHIANHAKYFPKLAELATKSIEIRCLTFEALTTECHIQEIDVLHTDTEGHDLIILNTIDFARWQPKVVLFEHKHAEPHDLGLFLTKLHRVGYRARTIGPDILCVRSGVWTKQAFRTGLVWWLIRIISPSRK